MGAGQLSLVRSHLELGGIPVKWDENFPYEHNFAGLN